MSNELMDAMWLIVSASLVLLMQAGFLAVESGLTRTKNSINVAIKNITDFGVATIVFWFIGFGLMFGTSVGGIIGFDHFLVSFPRDDFSTPAFFFFQLVFTGTAATIVSGAVAERLRFSVYIISTIVISSIIYPIAGHWVWGGVLENTGKGFLANQGFVDFAGSTVVHSVGGWVALALLTIIGPRTGRFPKDGPPQKINPSNLPLAMLGGIILWFGWMGFNGGSTLGVSEAVPSILLNTIFSLGTGLVVALLAGYIRKGYADPVQPLNGSLAGLVAITANCHAVSPGEALFIGAVAGALVMPAEKLLEFFKIDDAVGAIPVHLVAGIWGTLAVGIFGDLEILGTGLSRFQQINVQLEGVALIGIYAFGISWVLFKTVSFFKSLRVEPEDEHMGLNISEHKARTELVDLFLVMDHQKQTGDLSFDVPVEPFTEVGQIAERYNSVLQTIRETMLENTKNQWDLAMAYQKVQEEQEKADKLLLNILPKTIAEQLKKDDGVIAQSYPQVTVLFADLVGFTQLASKFPAEAVVHMLNKIFSTFDDLVEKYELEKIKTIGDAYMVVGGLPLQREDHANAVVRLALEMQERLSRFKIKNLNRRIEMRIGINTGPVVAGVIGTRKFIYDIWGDAVNIAARMESAGIAGAIQVTDATARLIQDDFEMEERGEIEVKGRGKIKTWFVKSSKEAAKESVVV